MELQPGSVETVTLQLNERAFQYYDADKAAWALDSGTFRVLVGASSTDIRLAGTLDL